MNKTTELLGKLTEGLTTLSKTEEIVERYKTENISEAVEKMKKFTKKQLVYLKYQEFIEGLEDLESSDRDEAQNFLKIMEKTFETQKAKLELKKLILEQEFEKAEELLPKVQGLRNELAELHVEFLGL